MTAHAIADPAGGMRTVSIHSGADGERRCAVSGVRFAGDPLVSVSGQFPLGPAGCAVPEYSESPSGPLTRPFGLRWLTDMGIPTRSASYRYCPVQQVAVHVVTGLPRPPQAKLEWTTISHKDGDEGPSKDYNWETVPDDE